MPIRTVVTKEPKFRRDLLLGKNRGAGSRGQGAGDRVQRMEGCASSVDELLAIMMHHYVELIVGLAHSQSFGIVNCHRQRIPSVDFIN